VRRYFICLIFFSITSLKRKKYYDINTLPNSFFKY
jgi:hypothetical protein